MKKPQRPLRGRKREEAMKKTLGVLVFVGLAVLAMAVPANAQSIRWGYIPQTTDGWYYMVRGDQVGMLTADNLGMVRGLTNQLRGTQVRSLTDDLMWNGVAYGINTGQGFRPMYDQNRQPLTKRQRIQRGAGIVVAADGIRRVINNPRGAAGWIEAAIGVVLVNDSRYRSQPKNQHDDNGVIVTPPSPGQGRRIASDGTPVAVGTRSGTTSPYWGLGASGGRPNCMETGMFTLENQSKGPLRVFRDGQRFEVLLPKEQKCAPLKGDYTGEIVGTVVSSDGLTGRVSTAPSKPESLPGLILVWR